MDTKHPSETTVKKFLASQLPVVDQTSELGPELIRKICRSDNEKGRWEDLKLKTAQMESDACLVNRHQPTTVCLKASDL